MQPSKDLFRLIKSLNKAEKRHFKLVATQYTSSSNYVKLFDAIDKQTVYDEAKIKRKFKAEIFAKKLAATKYLLYELILKSMRGLYEGKSINNSLNAMLNSVEVLYQKGLYEQSRKVLNRANKLANKYEKTFLSYDILKWRKRLFSYITPDKVSREMEDLLKEDHIITRNLHNETAFVELMDKVRFLKISRLPKVELDRHFEEIGNHPLMECEERALTFASKVHFYLIKSSCEQVQGNLETAFETLSKLLQLWNEHEKYIPTYTKLYTRSVSTYLQCGFQVKVDFDCTALLSRLQEIPHFMNEQTTKQVVTVEILEFIACISRGDLLDCDCQVKKVCEALETSGHLLDSAWLITVYYYISIYHFLKKDYNNALVWLGKIEPYHKLSLCTNIQDFAQLLELLVHYELENYTFLEYRLRTVYRKLKHRNQVTNIERLLLKYVRKLIFVNDPNKTTGLFQQFQAQMVVEKNTQYIPPMGNNIIQCWAKAHC